MPSINKRFGPGFLDCQIALASLPWGTPSEPYAVIKVAMVADPCATSMWVHHWLDADEITLSLARDSDHYWLRVPKQADFRLDPTSCEVMCSPLAPDLNDATLEHLLVDQILPRYLAHLGYVALHAAMLQVDGRTLLITAPSGWGKSTLAGLLALRGHALLSDDCSLLELADDRVIATPTYPSLRLWPDSAEALYPSGANTAPMAAYSDKQRVHGTAVHMDAQEVSALIVLGDPAESLDQPAFSPLRAVDACLALVRHSFQLDPGDKPRMATHLRTCSEIARRVPAFRFDYRRDFAQADAIVAALQAHAGTLPAADG